MTRNPNRRTVLRGVSAVAVSTLAGCSDTSDSDEGGDADGSNEEDSNDASGGEKTDGSGDRIEPPAEVDEYLSDANLYDGTVVDMATENAIEVSVGAGDGGLAFDPPAVRVSPDTEITWIWTGEGGAHNVVSESDDDEQTHDDDGEHSHDEGGGETLNSGDPEDKEGITYSETVSEPAVLLYHCHPHVEAGMKGAIVVDE